MSGLSDVISVLRGEASDEASMACKKENTKTTTAKNGVHSFGSVADNVQLKLLDEVETLKKAVLDTSTSVTGYAMIAYVCMSR